MDLSRLSAEIAYLRRRIQLELIDPKTGLIKEGAIRALVKSSPFSLEEEDEVMIARSLESQFFITQTRGALITKDYEPWLKEKSGELDFYYWNRLKSYYLDTGVLPVRVVATLDQITDEILDLCGDPTQDGGWPRRGMVMGHVQSGKTTNYSALIAKAADAGYRIIILLAGMTNSLRSQTQQRIDETFIGRRSIFQAAVVEQMPITQFGEGPIRFPAYGTSRDRDFRRENADYGVSISSLKEPIIFVLKKNKSVLENLYGWINGQRTGGRISYPMLLIDDEADNASVNTASENKAPTAINDLIRDIMLQFERTSYVGYTATPFANIFIEPETDEQVVKHDLFPANYIKALDPPNNYVGASRIFSESGDLRNVMIRTVEDYKDILPLTHKRDHEIARLPDSLLEAIRVYFLVRALRVLDGQGIKHSTMMINVSRFNDIQERIMELAYTYAEQLKDSIRLNAGLGDEGYRNSLFAQLRDTFDKQYGHLGKSFEQLRSVLHEACRLIEVRTVNMRGGMLDYEANSVTGLHVIAIGGLALSRGLTLEGLCVSYILRNTAASDTLMQMARWFGYRPGYEELCRLYLPQSSLDHYEYIEHAIEELRDEVKLMQLRNETPEQFGLKVRNSETGIAITAANKMRSAEKRQISLDISGRHVEGFAIYLDEKKSANEAALRQFIEFLGPTTPPADVIHKSVRQDLERHKAWLDVSGRDVLRLVSEFEFPPQQTVLSRITASRSLFEDYIADRLDAEAARWDVVMPLKRDGKEIELFGERLPLRSRTAGQLGSDPDGRRVYRTYGNKNRVADPGDKLLLLNEQERAKAESFKADYKGDSPFCRARHRPLMVIHAIEIQKYDDEGRAREGQTEGACSLSFMLPATTVAAATREYQVNAVYRRQLEIAFSGEEDDDEEGLENA